MCGVSAIINISGNVSSNTVVQLNACIAHRGPDGDGYRYFDSQAVLSEGVDWKVALAHQRLSILDLSANGNQPLSYADQQLWISFNGEIYNYVELKDDLIRKGYFFRTGTDTEVIMAAYQEWGTAAFAKLRGMWAFLLLDLRKKQLIACRDRMGIKPLYYYRNPNLLAFASEIKQLFQLPGIETKAERAVVKQYLLTGFEKTDRTFFADIKPVLPGTFVTLSLDGTGVNKPVSFWRPEEITPTIVDEQEAANAFRTMLEESVRIHLRSDVEVGCQLSGGVDSSSVFALMEKYYQGNAIHSFTVQFKGHEKDETPFVDVMLRNTKAVAHFITPTPEGFQENLRSFIWHHDEPVGSFAHYAGFELGRLIQSQKIKVVLNGQGGDEILGGYWQQYLSYLFGLGKSLQWGTLSGHLLGALSRDGNDELVRQLPAMFSRFRARKNMTFQFSKSFAEESPLPYFQNYFSSTEKEKRIFEIRNLILPRLLKWDDRNLMAFGVEGRYPFLDHKLIETALSFKTKILFKKGWTKYPLRVGMKSFIPKEIYFRKSKWGFETPQQQWLSGQMKPMLKAWINSEKPLDAVVGNNETKRIANDFWNHNKLEDAQTLLRLFLLDQWLNVFSVKL